MFKSYTNLPQPKYMKSIKIFTKWVRYVKKKLSFPIFRNNKVFNSKLIITLKKNQFQLALKSCPKFLTDKT